MQREVSGRSLSAGPLSLAASYGTGTRPQRLGPCIAHSCRWQHAEAITAERHRLLRHFRYGQRRVAGLLGSLVRINVSGMAEYGLGPERIMQHAEQETGEVGPVHW